LAIKKTAVDNFETSKDLEDEKKKEKANWQRSSRLQGVGPFLQMFAATPNETAPSKSGENQSPTKTEPQHDSEGDIF
jgi:hypothetical protein